MEMIDYNKYSANQLRYMLNSTRKQIKKLEDAIFLANKQIDSLTKKHTKYLKKEAILSKELSLRFPIPNEETRNALDNDFVVYRGYSHKEFEKSLENEND